VSNIFVVLCMLIWRCGYFVYCLLYFAHLSFIRPVISLFICCRAPHPLRASLFRVKRGEFVFVFVLVSVCLVVAGNNINCYAEVSCQSVHWS
jgi:hypothetical protein